MAIDIKFDLSGNPETPTIILATRSGKKLGQLDVNDIELSDKFVNACEITFTLNKYVDGKVTNLWDKVVNFKLIYCKEWDVWFEIRVELDEATETVKTVFCTQLGQAELSQIMLYDIEINTEKDIERDDYKISILYDEKDSEASILDRLLDKAPHYSIIHVDSTIKNIQRSFSFDGISIYDAFQDIAEEIGCLFVFHSNSDQDGNIQRTISVYDLEQNCLNMNCGHRGEFVDICPKCGSTNIKYGYGEDTLIYVTADELAADSIEFITHVDSVKNCFKLEAGDDLMTATIRNCNPNGTDYIWHFADSIKEDMSKELTDKIEAYDEVYKYHYNDYESNINTNLLNDYNELVNKYSIYNEDLETITMPIKGYSSLMKAYYNVIDLSLYLESGLMPSVEMSETSAENESKLLTATSLSPVSIADITTASLSTINNAVLSMAKIIVKSTYKVEINTSDMYDNGNTRVWRGSFTITNYSDEEDTAITNIISITINDDYESFVKQKIEKTLNKENTDDLSISGLFKKDYPAFCLELKKYALNPLNSLHEACQGCIDILIEQGVGSQNTWGDTDEGADSNLYEKLYVPYYNKLIAIESEIKLREDEISVVLGVYNSNGVLVKEGLAAYIEKNKVKIQEILNFEKYLGEELWLEFSSYRREDKYSNENYISDGLNNAELFEKALEFIEVAEKEIYKSAELQHSISTTLNNLLAIEKFKPLIQSFKVGNWIRVRVDDQIYKLRLLEYEISYKDFDNIPVEFSDVTKIKDGFTDLESILSQASSMATSYDSIQKQAKQGNDAKNTIDHWLADGLNSALVQIQNNIDEEVTMDKGGLLCRSYSDITESYSPKQLKLTHNILAYTSDNWKTVSTALGEHKYAYWDGARFIDDVDYGLSTKFVTAGYVTGSQIIGGEIISSNYKSGESGTYLNLIDGDFDFAGGKIVYNTNDNTVTLRDVTIEWANTNAPDIAVTDISGLDKYLDQLDQLEDQLDGRVQTYSQTNDPSINWDATEKSKHVGDLWFNPNDGLTKRWSGTTWVTVTDSELAELAKSKAQIFTITPTPPYYVGDLWVQGETGDIMHCVKSRQKGTSYNSSDWKKSSRYTDDTKANSAYSLAENAKDIGNTLVNGLGFQQTEITGEYIISPVIAGGSLLIGDTTGTYAQISTNGTLSCVNANVSGTINAEQGYIGGFSLIDKVLCSEEEAYINPAREDANKILKYVAGNISFTEDELLAHDFNGSGTITSMDARWALQIAAGNRNYVDCANAQRGKVQVKITPFDSERVVNVSGINALGTTIENYLGINGLKTVNVQTQSVSIDGNLVSAPVLLYSNQSGTNGTVTLSDSVSSYDWLYIIVGTSDVNVSGAIIVNSPQNKTVNISESLATPNGVSIRNAYYTIVGNTLIPSSDNCCRTECTANSSSYEPYNTLYCKYVIGFKGASLNVL